MGLISRVSSRTYRCLRMQNLRRQFLRNFPRVKITPYWKNHVECEVREASEKLYNKPFANAACLVPLCIVDNEPALLLIKRASPSHTSSKIFQYSYPGGAEEPSDLNNLCSTALRETTEELPGLKNHSIKIWNEKQP